MSSGSVHHNVAGRRCREKRTAPQAEIMSPKTAFTAVEGALPGLFFRLFLFYAGALKLREAAAPVPHRHEQKYAAQSQSTS